MANKLNIECSGITPDGVDGVVAVGLPGHFFLKGGFMPEEKAYCFKKDFDGYLTDIGVHVESQIRLVDDLISDIGPKGIDEDKASLR